jgi:hypothetical protein
MADYTVTARQPWGRMQQHAEYLSYWCGEQRRETCTAGLPGCRGSGTWSTRTNIKKMTVNQSAQAEALVLCVMVVVMRRDPMSSDCRGDGCGGGCDRCTLSSGCFEVAAFFCCSFLLVLLLQLFFFCLVFSCSSPTHAFMFQMFRQHYRAMFTEANTVTYPSNQGCVASLCSEQQLDPVNRENPNYNSGLYVSARVRCMCVCVCIISNA